MKKVFATLSVALIVVACGFGWNHISVLKKMDFGFGKEHESENGENEAADANGMVELFAKMRNNPATGSIDYNDYYKAREDAKQFAAAGFRGGLNLDWQSMGPDNQGGRTRAILIDKFNSNHVFAGGVSGGLWVSNNAGTTWDRVTGSDEFTSLEVSCITQAGNGNIYFGTGEYFGFFQSAVVVGATGFPGGGIWCSTDTGRTFKNIQVPAYTGGKVNPNAAFAFVTAMAADPTDPNKVYVATNGVGNTKALQIINASTNTLSSAVGTGFQNSQATDVDVASDGTVHAVVGTKYFRMAAGSSAGFVAVGNTGLPTGIDRMGIAVSPQDPNYVYAIASYATSAGSLIKGLWQSTDGGTTFAQLAGASTTTSPVWLPVTQGAYALTLEVSPIDKNMFIFGGIDVYRYTPTGGAVKISNWNIDFLATEYVHADIHCFKFVPNSNAMYVGSDGGLNYTTDVSNTNVIWITLNNQYITTQCYDVCAKNFTGEILTGMQDNGNWYIDFKGNTTRFGTLIKGGDGGTVGVSTINPDILYAEYVFGALARSSNNGGSFGGFYDNNIDCNLNSGTVPPSCNPDGVPDDGAPFIMQYKLWENIYDPNPSSQSKFIAGTNSNVWLTQDALNLVTTPVWFKLTKAKLNSAVSALAFSADGKTIFAGTEAGGLYRIDGLDTILSYSVDSTTKKASFSPDSFHIRTTMIYNFGNRFVTGIDVDNNDKNHVVVTLGNYGSDAFVYESNNAMALDTSVSTTVNLTSIMGTGLPKMPVYCVLIDKKNSNDILIGTEIGVYSTTNGGSSWAQETSGMPDMPVLKFYRHFLGDQDNVIEAATYGRGVFRTTSAEFTSVHDVSSTIKPTVNVYPNPATTSITLNTVIPNLTDGEINIYSLEGKLVKTTIIKELTPGAKTINLGISDLSVGTYLLSFKGKGLNVVSKFMVIR